MSRMRYWKTISPAIESIDSGLARECVICLDHERVKTQSPPDERHDPPPIEQVPDLLSASPLELVGEEVGVKLPTITADPVAKRAPEKPRHAPDGLFELNDREVGVGVVPRPRRKALMDDVLERVLTLATLHLAGGVHLWASHHHP
jgi:hypothetical protein